MEDESHDETSRSLSMHDVAGTWRSDETGNPFLALNAEGTAWGTDGCNGINTTYSISGKTITLDPWISTLRACYGVNPWLRMAHTGRIDGETMTVYNHDGSVIGTLTRSAEDVTNS